MNFNYDAVEELISTDLSKRNYIKVHLWERFNKQSEKSYHVEFQSNRNTKQNSSMLLKTYGIRARIFTERIIT